jgi:hypothetical protein
VIFILALITIGEIYAGAALTSGKASHVAAPDSATQLSRMGSNAGKWPTKAAPSGFAIAVNQVGFLIFGRTPSVDGRPRVSRR